VAASAVAGAAAAFSSRALPPESSITDRPIQVSEDGYVSSQTCRACHPSQYNTWHQSYHRTMTQVATPETAVADFDGVTIDGVHGRPMRLARRGTELWAEFDDPDSSVRPDERSRIERRVVMITGSHHQQVYWYATGRNRLLGQLPGAYLIGERQWIPRRAAVLHPPTDPPFSETGHWNSTCIACHATFGKPQFDTPFGSQPLETQDVQTTAAEFGIACEACHGPAADHVAKNRNPLRRYGLHLSFSPDSTTTKPDRLLTDRSSEVCGQCHGIWEFLKPEDERAANIRGLPYRPGDELAATRFVARPTINRDSPTMQTLLADDGGFLVDSFWPDGKVRVSGREYNGLVESPCFAGTSRAGRLRAEGASASLAVARGDSERAMAGGEKRLSCFSCHTMHKADDDRRSLLEWADDQLGVGMDGNAACLQCHDKYRANLTVHTKHAADSSGSSCYNCHMPYTTYGLLKTIRSHTISNPSANETVDAGRPNACNLCHLDKTLEWTADAMNRWYGMPKPELEADDRATAASVLWMLRGDAGQRAIAAQAMSWLPAQQASGTKWMAPHLATLLDDPYDAVRFIAIRSLRTLPGFADFQYNFVSSGPDRRQAQLRTMSTWDRVKGPGGAMPQTLVRENGSVDVETVLRLLKARNTRRVLLRE
jgi:Cytochrome c552/Doubled CXXCH motif (Paired_CXXCH_1)/Cytochrome c554 and c-prime